MNTRHILPLVIGLKVLDIERTGTRDGTPQAIQGAHRFHLIQNLHERTEQQLGRLGRPLKPDTKAAAEREDTRAGLHGTRKRLFAEVRALYGAGKTATTIPKSSVSAANGSTAGSG